MKYILIFIFAFFFNIVPVKAQELTDRELEYMEYIAKSALNHCFYALKESSYSQEEKALSQYSLGYQDEFVKKIIREEYPEFLPNYHRDLILSIYTCMEGIKQY